MSDQPNPLASPEWRGIVASLRTDPADDATRLVAADWLRDRNRPDLDAWADFVAHQVAADAHRRWLVESGVAAHEPNEWCDCGSCRPERQAAILFDRWGGIWSGLIGADDVLVTVDGSLWTRGFPAAVAARIEPQWRPDKLNGGDWKRLEHRRPADAVKLLFERAPVVGAAVALSPGGEWVATCVRRDGGSGPFAQVVSTHSRAPYTVTTAETGISATPDDGEVVMVVAKTTNTSDVDRASYADRQPPGIIRPFPTSARLKWWSTQAAGVGSPILSPQARRR